MDPASSHAAVTSPVPREAWEAVVRADSGALVSQALAWRDAVCAAGRHQDASLLYEFPSGKRVVLPMVRRRGQPSWAAVVASWPRAWGIGGPISEGGRVGGPEAAAVLADVARRGTLMAEIQLRPGADGNWLREAHQFRVQQHGCHILDLAGGFGEVWERRFRSTARRAVRKAERSGLDVEVDRAGRLLPEFWGLYQASVRRWAVAQHEPLLLTRWRSLADASPVMLASVAKHFADDCAIWLARSGGEPIAAIIVLRSGGYAKYWRGAMEKALAGPARANDLLHQLAIEEACRDGYRFYDMGLSRPGSPLAAFKEKLGATLRVSHTLRAERVPIHTAGRMSREVVKRVIGFRDV